MQAHKMHTWYRYPVVVRSVVTIVCPSHRALWTVTWSQDRDYVAWLTSKKRQYRRISGTLSALREEHTCSRFSSLFPVMCTVSKWLISAHHGNGDLCSADKLKSVEFNGYTRNSCFAFGWYKGFIVRDIASNWQERNKILELYVCWGKRLISSPVSILLWKICVIVWN